MYNNLNNFIVGFLVILFVIILCTPTPEQEGFKGFFKKVGKTFKKVGKTIKKPGPAFKKIGKSIKKVVQSPIGIALCGPPCAIAAAAVTIALDNKKRKKRFKRDRKREAYRRTRVLTGREMPHKREGVRGQPLFDIYEASSKPCGDFRKMCGSNRKQEKKRKGKGIFKFLNRNTMDAKCKGLETQCRLARSVTYYDSHLIQEGKPNKVEQSRL